MANFVARYCGGDGHYADVECAYGELERYLVLSCNTRYWKEEGHQFGGLSYSRRAQELPPLVFEGCGLIIQLGNLYLSGVTSVTLQRLRTSNCSA
jgi:hypothetical protein